VNGTVIDCEVFNEYFRDWNIFPNLTAESLSSLECFPSRKEAGESPVVKIHLYSCIQITKKMHPIFVRYRSASDLSS
jgi:hypothetical protein